MDYSKINMKQERTSIEWGKLLDAVKINFNNFLSKDEQDYFVKEIENKMFNNTEKTVEILNENIGAFQESCDDIIN